MGLGTALRPARRQTHPPYNLLTAPKTLAAPCPGAAGRQAPPHRPSTQHCRHMGFPKAGASQGEGHASEGRPRTLCYDLSFPPGEHFFFLFRPVVSVYEGLFDLHNNINSLALKYHHLTNDSKLSKPASLLGPNENVYCLLQPQPIPPNSPCAQQDQ